MQFKFSNCIRSIFTKTNTNLFYTNLLHLISRKIGHVIQVVVHQIVHKTSTKKIPKSEKNQFPYKPYVRRNT